MSDHYEKTLALLQRHLSHAVAKALLARTLKEHGVTQSSLSRAELSKMGPDLRRGARLFVEGSRRSAADEDIARHCGTGQLPDSVRLAVKGEQDIGRVRSEARRLCTECGANAFSMQKVATVVSELARNMVLYAGGGELSISPLRKSTDGAFGALEETKVRLCARDQGPGIPNLDHILSGDYRSKTGLGRGLLGTKRLAVYFDVATGPSGTTITAEVAL